MKKIRTTTLLLLVIAFSSTTKLVGATKADKAAVHKGQFDYGKDDPEKKGQFDYGENKPKGKYDYDTQTDPEVNPYYDW